MLKEKISSDLKAALKEGREQELGVLRLLISALHNKEIEKKSKGDTSPLTDEEVVGFLRTEVKKRREAADLFQKGGRNDLAEQEIRENEIIAPYLPTQMEGAALEKKIDEIIAKQDSKRFPEVMKEVMAELKGKADAKLITELIKKKISG